MSDEKLTFSGHKQLQEYRAKVVDDEDPKKLLRVKVRVPGWWDAVPDDDLPWAEYRFNDARYRGGQFVPAEVDDWVWIDFPNGDTRYPRITGWCHFAPEGEPEQPHESWLGPEMIVHKLDSVNPEPKPEDPKYHKSQVMEKHGVVVEINPEGELLVTQRDSGTAIRVTKEGDITFHSEKNLFSSSVEDTRQHTVKDWKIKVDGNWIVDVAGFIDIKAAGFIKVTSGTHHGTYAPRIDHN